MNIIFTAANKALTVSEQSEHRRDQGEFTLQISAFIRVYSLLYLPLQSFWKTRFTKYLIKYFFLNPRHIFAFSLTPIWTLKSVTCLGKFWRIVTIPYSPIGKKLLPVLNFSNASNRPIDFGVSKSNSMPDSDRVEWETPSWLINSNNTIISAAVLPRITNSDYYWPSTPRCEKWKRKISQSRLVD